MLEQPRLFVNSPGELVVMMEMGTGFLVEECSYRMGREGGFPPAWGPQYPQEPPLPRDPHAQGPPCLGIPLPCPSLSPCWAGDAGGPR